MKKILNLTLILTTSLVMSQVKSDYKVYQFFANDSLNGHFSKIVKYNSKGLIKYEERIGYKTSKYDGFVDIRETYFYDDTLIIKTLLEYPKGIIADSGRVKYKYDTENRLIKKTHYNYKKRLLKELEFGDCLIDSTDFEKEATWAIRSEISFKYDSNGQKSEFYAPEFHWDSQNHYKYYYDEENRIVQETSLNHDELVWHKYYSYVDNGYDYIIDWDGEYKIKTLSDWPHRYGIRYKLDKKGNKIEEKKLSKDGSQKYRVVRTFDKSSRITSEKRFDSKDNIELTKIYYYE